MTRATLACVLDLRTAARGLAVLETHLVYLCCPACRADLALANPVRAASGRIESGCLDCADCRASYPIVRFIPRFVAAENYAGSFGLEWTRHARTQYDGHSGVTLSEQRFFGETGWPHSLPGEVMLEAGCGSGRFTEHAAATGAQVFAFDLSAAVDANYASNGHRDNVCIVQASLLEPPFRDRTFDRIFCFGVLQHTPDPRRAFLAMRPLLAPGGSIVVDVYKKTFVKLALHTKYWVRPLTRGRDPERLYRGLQRYVDFMWPLACVIRRIPRLGPLVNWRLLVGDYSKDGVPAAHLKDWAVLEAFDMLSPRYDKPQTLAAVQKWFRDADLEGVDVRYGYNGIQGRAVRAPGRLPAEPAPVRGVQAARSTAGS